MKLKSILLTAVVTIGLATATIAQVPNYVPTNGLVGWWPFNGNANDESGNRNNGVVNGASLTMDRFGNVNSSYNFNGTSNYIEVAHNSTFNFQTPNSVSFSLWIKTSMNSGAMFVQKQAGVGSTQNGVNCGILASNGYLTGVAKEASGVQSLIASPAVGYNNNQWHHFVYTFSSGNANIYLDGVLLSSQTNSGSVVANSTTNLIFGYGLPLNNFFYNGRLDDIGIWNRALTQQEVKNLYDGNICYQYITVRDTLLINMSITGFNPVTYNNTIKIFPNPANNYITIDYGNFASLNGYQLKIINSLSQQVFQTNITQQSNYLNLTSWGGNGLYFVQIIDPQGNIIDIRKIVLQ